MSTFTNKSTVELIPQNKINSDWGVIRSGKASFNDFDESKYFDENGTVNEVGIKFITRLLRHKHKSTFFLSNISFIVPTQIDYNKLTKEEIAGMERHLNGKQYHYVISVYLAMRWLYYKPSYISVEILEVIEYQLKQHFQVCYKALQMLPKEDVTEEEKDLLARYKTSFIALKLELPIFVARQLYRHKAIRLCEKSGRYTAEGIEFFKPDAWRKAPEKATQGSIENEFVEERNAILTTEAGSGMHNIPEMLCNVDIIQDNNIQSHFKALAELIDNSVIFECDYENLVKHNAEWYQNNLENGMCKEQARMILPQSQITVTINSVDLTSLSSILYLRLDNHAQKEMRDLAQQIYGIACQEFGEELIDKLIDIQNRLTF
jgi:thymidylate synthase (FAD)